MQTTLKMGHGRISCLKFIKLARTQCKISTLPVRSTINRYDSFYVGLEFVPQDIENTDSQPAWNKWKLSTWTPAGAGITLSPEDIANWTVGCILSVDYSSNYSNPLQP